MTKYPSTQIPKEIRNPNSEMPKDRVSVADEQFAVSLGVWVIG